MNDEQLATEHERLRALISGNVSPHVSGAYDFAEAWLAAMTVYEEHRNRQPATAIPPLPDEPSEKMLVAGIEASKGLAGSEVRAIYRAAVAAHKREHSS